MKPLPLGCKLTGRWVDLAMTGWIVSIAVVLMVSSLPLSAVAEEFYRGKTIRLLVGSAPGGGSDILGRIVARNLAKHIPGQPTIIVQNMPGGSGVVATKYAYHVAKPDGLTILQNTGIVLDQVLRGPKDYDLRKMPMLAGAAEAGISVFRVGASIESVGALFQRKKPLFVAGMTRTSQKDLNTRIPLELFSVPYKYVTGYRGTGPIRAALERGEVDVTVEPVTTLKSILTPKVKEGQIVLLYQSGITDTSGQIVRDPVAPDIPTVVEVYEETFGKQPSGPIFEAYRFLAGVRSLNRDFRVLPNTPPERIATLRKAFAATFQDPEFIAQITRTTGAPLTANIGEDADKISKAVLDAPETSPQGIDWLQKFIKN